MGDREPSRSLMVRNLSQYARAEDLREIAGKFGEVRDVYIPRNYYTQQPRGLAFIEFTDPLACEDAGHEMEGIEIEGRPISVNVAREKRKGPEDFRRGGGRGRYDDRRGGGYEDRRGGGGGYDRRGGYEDRRGGYDDRRGGHEDRRGGYEDRRGGGYDDRRGGYEDRRGGGSGGYVDRRGGAGGSYDDRRSGGDMRRADDREYDDRRAPRVDDRRDLDYNARSNISPARERARSRSVSGPPRETSARSPPREDDSPPRKEDSLDPPGARPALQEDYSPHYNRGRDDRDDDRHRY